MKYEDSTDAAEGQQTAELFERASLLERIQQGITMRRVIGVASAAIFATTATEIGIYEYDTHHAVPNHVVTLPSSQIPNIVSQSPLESLSPSASKSPEQKKSGLPEIAPHAPTELIIPKLDINVGILPVSSTPTGQKNPWGGEIYHEVTFPWTYDRSKQRARYWVQQGEPNTLKNVTFAQDPKAVMRTVIYGHASDLGHHLLFQDLQELKLGDTFSLIAGGYEFTYTVYSLSNPAKDGLADDSQVYGLPKGGRKEAALVACLPDSASHSVRIGYLSQVKPVPEQSHE